jgi:hypothetical protein
MAIFTRPEHGGSLRCILRRDQYPDAEPNQILLSAQKKHDAFMDQLGLHPKDPD